MTLPRLGSVVCLITDLFFVAKTEHPLQQLGLTTHFVQSGPEFLQALRRQNPVLAIIDLRSKGVDAVELIRQVRADDELKGTALLAFGDHVNAPLLEAAREAGADEVVTNGHFSAHLPTIVSQYL